MIRIAAFAAAALLAAAAQPAAAQSLDQTARVTVKIAGKSEAAVMKDIRRAAYEACAEAHGPQTGASDTLDVLDCQRKTETQALASFREAAAAAAPTQVATLSQPVK